MAWDSTCSECAYIDALRETNGKFPCTNKRSNVSVVRADRPKCDYFCAVGVGKRTTRECRDLENISKQYGRYYIVTAITEILNLTDKSALAAFIYIKDVYMPTKDEFVSFLEEYEIKGLEVAKELRNDKNREFLAMYFYDNFLVEFTALVHMGAYDEACILYLEMYDKMLEYYKMISCRIRPTTLKLTNPEFKGQF